jgi:hypothetical protein
MKSFAPAFVAAALLLVPSVSPGQSLGDVAAKEKEKKDKDKARKPAKSYTEDDLRGKLGGTMSNPGATASVPAGTSATAGDASASPAPDEAAPSAEEQEAKAKEWRERRGRIQQEVVRITAAINSFQARLADNTQPMYGPGRDALVQNLERSKTDLARAQADLDAADAEGRTNGYR